MEAFRQDSKNLHYRLLSGGNSLLAISAPASVHDDLRKLSLVDLIFWIKEILFDTMNSMKT